MLLNESVTEDTVKYFSGMSRHSTEQQLSRSGSGGGGGADGSSSSSSSSISFTMMGSSTGGTNWLRL